MFSELISSFCHGRHIPEYKDLVYGNGEFWGQWRRGELPPCLKGQPLIRFS